MSEVISQIKQPRKNVFAALIFLFLAGCAVAGGILQEEFTTLNLIFFGITLGLTDAVIFPSLVYSFIAYNHNILQESKQARAVFKAIFAYVIYEFTVIFVLSLVDNKSNLTVQNVLRNIVQRIYFIIIPFFAWWVLPRMKNLDKYFRIVSYSSLIIFVFHLSNFILGIYSLTETGNKRYGWVGATLLYGFTLTNSLELMNKSRKGNNLFLLFTSLLGIVFIAHRSVFNAVLFIVAMAFLISKDKGKNLRIYKSAIYFALGGFVMTQLSGIGADFVERFTSADTQTGNLASRIVGWEFGAELFRDNWLFGLNFNTTNFSNAVSQNMNFVNIFHNFFMQILVTEGALGFVFHITILIFGIKTAVKNKKDPISNQMLIYYLYFLFVAFFNVTYANPGTLFFSIFPLSVILYRDRILTNQQNI